MLKLSKAFNVPRICAQEAHAFVGISAVSEGNTILRSSRMTALLHARATIVRVTLGYLSDLHLNPKYASSCRSDQYMQLYAIKESHLAISNRLQPFPQGPYGRQNVPRCPPAQTSFPSTCPNRMSAHTPKSNRTLKKPFINTQPRTHFNQRRGRSLNTAFDIRF